MSPDELKDQVENLLMRGEYTVQDICRELGVEDDFEVIQSIAKLEFEGKSKSTKYKQVHDTDGSSILMAKYTHTQNKLT